MAAAGLRRRRDAGGPHGGRSRPSELLWDTWREQDDHDWIGVSCSHAIAVTGDGSFVPWPLTAEAGPMGWAPWPEALGHTLHRVADERAGRPLVLLTGAWDTDEERRDETAPGPGPARWSRRSPTASTLRQVHWWSAVDGYEG